MSRSGGAVASRQESQRESVSSSSGESVRYARVRAKFCQSQGLRVISCRPIRRKSAFG